VSAKRHTERPTVSVYEALGLPKPRLIVTRKPTVFNKKQEADMLARMQHSQRLRERYAYVDGDAESEGAS
jgi:hypothetical protein